MRHYTNGVVVVFRAMGILNAWQTGSNPETPSLHFQAVWKWLDKAVLLPSGLPDCDHGVPR